MGGDVDPIFAPRQDARRTARFRRRQVRHVTAPARKEQIRRCFGTACAKVLSIPSAPTTRRSISRDRNRWAGDDFTKIPNGIPALEDRVNLLYTYGVKAGRLDLHTFVNVASTNAAKIFNLFPRKGTIQPGSDADLVVYDPDYRGKLSAETHLMNIDYNAFEGWPIEGRPSVVTVRGEVAVRDGKFVGTVGRGQFLQRPT